MSAMVKSTAVLAALALCLSPAWGWKPSASPGRKGLREALLAAGLLVPFGALETSPVWAALPTFDEYNGGQGSVKRQQQNLNKGRKAGEATPAAVVQDTVTLSLREAAKTALTALDGLDDLVRKSSFEDARGRLANTAITNLGVRISPSRAIVKPAGAFISMQCRDDQACESALQEARSALGQLEEFLFSNRISFFNSDDKTQIMRLQEETGGPKVDLDEPILLLETARDALAEIRDNAF